LQDRGSCYLGCKENLLLGIFAREKIVITYLLIFPKIARKNLRKRLKYFAPIKENLDSPKLRGHLRNFAFQKTRYFP
jgi:hypothetical protein